MKELTDEQYETMYFDIMKRTKGNPFPQKNLRIDAARAAYAASFPFAVAKARLAVLEQRCERNTPWDLAIMACVKAIDALLTKPDHPAVEAVWQRLRMQNSWPHPDSEESQKLKVKAREIVDLVRSADGAK